MTSYLNFLSITACVCVLTAAGSTVSAHPYHVSIAEMEYNEESGKLQVALRAWPADLEKSLRIMHGKRVDIDKTENVDELISEYLNQAFQIRTTSGKKLKIEWVGKEIDVKHAWLYFEIPVNSLEKFEITNRVCFEAERTQINTVLFKQGRQRLSLQCTQQDPVASFDLENLK